jgi:hypothetical protein
MLLHTLAPLVFDHHTPVAWQCTHNSRAQPRSRTRAILFYFILFFTDHDSCGVAVDVKKKFGSKKKKKAADDEDF